METHLHGGFLETNNLEHVGHDSNHCYYHW